LGKVGRALDFAVLKGKVVEGDTGTKQLEKLQRISWPIEARLANKIQEFAKIWVDARK